jgi:hypothetical protein
MSQHDNHPELNDLQLEEIKPEDQRSDHAKLMDAYARINEKLDLLKKRLESHSS